MDKISKLSIHYTFIVSFLKNFPSFQMFCPFGGMVDVKVGAWMRIHRNHCLKSFEIMILFKSATPNQNWPDWKCFLYHSMGKLNMQNLES